MVFVIDRNNLSFELSNRMRILILTNTIHNKRRSSLFLLSDHDSKVLFLILVWLGGPLVKVSLNHFESLIVRSIRW